MNAPPYLPWFHGDFLRSTAGWTLLERGVFWMLLCAQWENGPLPNDPARLAGIAGISATDMKTVWPVVGKKFSKTRAGLLINQRMEEHRDNNLRYRQAQSERGKLRWKSKTGSNVVQLERDAPGKTR